jgi:hypothetical protein
MSQFYLFALVVGGGLLLLSAFSDIFGDADVDAGDLDLDTGGFDLDADGLDLDTDGFDLDADGATGPAGGAHGLKILSLRSITYLLFGIGATGTILTWFGTNPVVTAVAAAAAGALTMTLVVTVFRYLARTETGGLEGEQGFVGLPAEVTVPINAQGHGRVLVRRRDRTYELAARPFEVRDGDPGHWRSVVVVDMEGGVALIAPLEQLTEGG